MIAHARPGGAPDPAIRCRLFHGVDEAGSRALATQFAATLGADAERVDFAPAQLKADPALLPDEAASVSLFGGARYIRVEGAGDDCLAAVDALLTAPAAGNPVVLIAGVLRKDSRLLARIVGDPLAVATVSLVPDIADLGRAAVPIAAAFGLRIDPELGRRLAELAGNDRAVMVREIEKLADFVDAAPDTPRVADEATVDAIAADRAEIAQSAVIDALASGDPRALEGRLSRLAGDGQIEIPLLRATLRRLIAMAAVRADVDRGASARAAADRAARSLFGRDRDAVARDAGRWTAAALADAIDRVAALERELKSSHGPGAIALDRLYHALARQVRR